jgi:pimeloyl-ACP methyl ester carboxylesterase
VPQSTEVQGWARLIAGVADEAIAGTVQGLHRTICDRAFRWAGPVGRPIKPVHDAVVDGVYGTVRAALRGAGELGAAMARRSRAHSRLGEPDRASSVALKARAIATGVLDERFIELAPELDLDVSLRRDGREVSLDVPGLRVAYPDACPRITVFVHGLVDTEAVWTTSSQHATPDGATALGEVAARLGTTPVFVRYGTGRAVGRNGTDLAGLLEAVVTGWPVPVDQLTIVGHSMGGLVARAAGITARERDHSWVTALSDVVYLGTPHLGSWLEKAANVGTWTLRHSSPYSAPFGTLIDGRSRGIKDLRFGTLVEDGWGETPIDGLLTGLAPDDPWLDDVTHHVVVGRLRPSPRHPLNVIFGDGLVRKASAAGSGRRRRIGDGEVAVIPIDARHGRSIHHPEVTTLLHRVLAAS